MTNPQENSGLKLEQVLIEWLQEVFGEGFYSDRDFIEYYGYMLLVKDITNRPNLRKGCKHIVCLNELPFADPLFFEKLKPAVEKRINYLHEFYLRNRATDEERIN
jgi:hypothetical protein